MKRDIIIASAANATFGKPLVNNVMRAILAEAIIDAALSDSWKWCSGDWAECDFIHDDGTRLEVKQSALRQSWHDDDAAPSKPSFDIAPRKMVWREGRWEATTGRNAEIYVFALHPVTGAKADHREPAQWQFYTVPTTALPSTKRITLTAVERLSSPVGYTELLDEVEAVRQSKPDFRQPA